jgi:hypothetical protein
MFSGSGFYWGGSFGFKKKLDFMERLFVLKIEKK